MKIVYSEWRNFLHDLHEEGRYDEIAMAEEIRIAERRNPAEDARNTLTCLWYVFGTSACEIIQNHGGHIVVKGHEEVTEPLKDDVVLYSKDTPGLLKRCITHVGIYMGNELVRSKWCFGHVYVHPLGDIPQGWGDEARFYRKLHSTSGTKEK